MRKLFIMLVCFTVWSGSVAAKSLPIRIYVQGFHHADDVKIW